MRRIRAAVRPRGVRTLLVGALGGALVVGGLSAAPAEAASTFPLAVTAVSAAPGALPHQVRVRWTGGGRAAKVAVIAGSSAGVDRGTFHSAWYPATTREITVTVPTRMRPWLGGGSGNPVWLKVVQSNGPSRAFSPMSDVARAYRVTPAGRWAFAAGPAAPTSAAPPQTVPAGTVPAGTVPAGAVPAGTVPAGTVPAGTGPAGPAPAAPALPVADPAPTRLRVAEFNVQSLTATKGFSEQNRWRNRAQRVADAVVAARPDLLLTAELTTNKVDGCTDHPNQGRPYVCRQHSQLGDLAKRLPALRLADADAYDRAMDRTRQGSAAKPMTSGAHIFYNPLRLRVLDHGFLAPATPVGDRSLPGVQGLGVSGWSGTNALGPDRWLSWARLRTTDATARTFVAVAVHLPAGMSKAVIAGRSRESAAIRAAVVRIAGDAPVVLAGDMNSDPLLDPAAPQVDFVRDGWFDAAGVASRSLRGSIRFATANDEPGMAGDAGYPVRPVPRRFAGGRIDFILLKGSPYTYGYRNVLHLNPDGSFVPRLRGSDHNMQLAIVGIGGPAGTAAEGT